MDMEYYVYILASKKYGTFYIGVTNDPLRRVHEHREDMISGFTKKYGVHKLVCLERDNPEWLDLWHEING